MIFKAKQFCSGYMYYSFEAKSPEEAAQIIAEINEGNEVDAVMKEDNFVADDGGEMSLIK